MNPQDRMKCILYFQDKLTYAEMRVQSMEQAFQCIPNVTLSGIVLPGAIELDPTTMLRIAEYNANKELELINAKIKVAQLELEAIKPKLKRLKGKYDEFIKFIANDFTDYEDDDEDD